MRKNSSLYKKQKAYVYRLINDAGDCIYVGTARDPKLRMVQHQEQSDRFAMPYTMQITHECESLADALLIEKSLHKSGLNGRCKTSKRDVRLAGIKYTIEDNDTEIDRITKMRDAGLSFAQIGEKVGLSASQVYYRFNKK